MAVTSYNSPLPREDSALRKFSRSASAFREISRSILYRGLTLDTDRQYDHLRNLFGFNKVESDILALLLARRVGFSDRKQPCRFLPSVSWSDVSDAWNRLILDGFVSERCDPDTGEFGMMPRPAFRLAVQEDCPLSRAAAILVEKEFIAGIKELLREESREEDDELPHPPGLWDDVDNKVHSVDEDEEAEQAASGSPFPTDNRPPMQVIESCLSEYADTPLASSVKALTRELDRNARRLLYGMMGWFVENFTRTFQRSDFKGKLANDYKTSLPILLEKGLVVSVYIWDEGQRMADSENYRISPRVAEVFRGMEKLFNFGVLAEFGTFTPLQDIRPKELFFSEQDRKAIGRLRRAAAPSEYKRIIAALKEAGLRPCLSALLWGAPGTGKTELARQVARESGRSILVVDVPKLFGIYVGEGSIRLRHLFQTYRYVCAVSSVAPILFMDEADGILSQRVSRMVSGVDKEANTCQSIILEELNTMPGMLIATTNLISHLDDAMLRRFMLRVEFHLPDPSTRASLWKSKVPSLGEEEAAALAGDYDISGGLIDNIVSIATVDTILEDRPVTAADIRRYCEEQGYGRGRQQKIGF